MTLGNAIDAPSHPARSEAVPARHGLAQTFYPPPLRSE